MISIGFMKQKSVLGLSSLSVIRKQKFRKIIIIEFILTID